jgi:phage portal protein BeeE
MVVTNSADYTAQKTYVDPFAEERAKGVFKAYIPEFYYKPPYGYPRNNNLLQLRKLAKTPYVHLIINTFAQQIANLPWEVRVKEEHAESVEEGAFDAKIKEVSEFFYHPNGNLESFNDILVQVVTDILEINTGIIVKVFDRQEKLVQMFARDGSTFLKNPDPYGYLGNRIDILPPLNINLEYAKPSADNKYEVDPSTVNADQQALLRNFYDENLRHSAAYFQYGWTAGAMPVPFGKREIVWFAKNPRSDDIYGYSPVEVLNNIISTLLYGNASQLDMYINSNIPAGVIQLLGANNDVIKGFKERFKAEFIKKDYYGNNYTQQWVAPVVNQEVKWTPFNVTSRDMQLLEGQLWYLKIAASVFGANPSELGFTEDSNKAVDQNQSAVFNRRALAPLIRIIQERINTSIMSEFGCPELEWVFDDYDYAGDKQVHDLLAQEITMGVKTPEMAAAELGINIDELRAGKEEERQKRMEESGMQNGMDSDNSFDDGLELIGSDDKKKVDASVKHKYIRREGSSGNYRYFYDVPKERQHIIAKETVSKLLPDVTDDKLSTSSEAKQKLLDYMKKNNLTPESFLIDNNQSKNAKNYLEGELGLEFEVRYKKTKTFFHDMFPEEFAEQAKKFTGTYKYGEERTYFHAFLGELGSDIRANNKKEEFIAELRETLGGDVKQTNLILKYSGFKERVTKNGFRNSPTAKSANEIAGALQDKEIDGLKYKISPTYTKGTIFKNNADMEKSIGEIAKALPPAAKKIINDGGTTIHFVTRPEASKLSSAIASNRTLGFYIPQTKQIFIFPERETRSGTFKIQAMPMMAAGYDDKLIVRLQTMRGKEHWKHTVTHELMHATFLNPKKEDGYGNEISKLQQDYDSFLLKLAPTKENRLVYKPEMQEEFRNSAISQYGKTNSQEDVAELGAWYALNKQEVDYVAHKTPQALNPFTVRKIDWLRENLWPQK